PFHDPDRRRGRHRRTVRGDPLAVRPLTRRTVDVAAISRDERQLPRSRGAPVRRRPRLPPGCVVAGSRPRFLNLGAQEAGTIVSESTARPSADGRGSYASVNGLDMYYEVHGDGRPLVLLHGAYSTIETDFGPMLPTLAQTRRVIGVEQQGFGHTADIDRPL